MITRDSVCIAVPLTALGSAACYPGGATDVSDLDLVATARNPQTDFGTVQTFVLRLTDPSQQMVAAAALVGARVTTAPAQTWYTALTYQPATPAGSTNDFINVDNQSYLTFGVGVAWAPGP